MTVSSTTDSAGDITLPLTIPTNDVLDGFPVHVQAAVVDPLGPAYLSNVVVRVIGI